MLVILTSRGPIVNFIDQKSDDFALIAVNQRKHLSSLSIAPRVLLPPTKHLAFRLQIYFKSCLVP